MCLFLKARRISLIIIVLQQYSVPTIMLYYKTMWQKATPKLKKLSTALSYTILTFRELLCSLFLFVFGSIGFVDGDTVFDIHGAAPRGFQITLASLI